MPTHRHVDKSTESLEVKKIKGSIFNAIVQSTLKSLLWSVIEDPLFMIVDESVRSLTPTIITIYAQSLLSILLGQCLVDW